MAQPPTAEQSSANAVRLTSLGSWTPQDPLVHGAAWGLHQTVKIAPGKSGFEKVINASLMITIGTVLLYLLIFFIYAASAAKLSYQRSGSGLFAFIAFILGPLYFPYYAFTQPTISTATMGAARKMLRHML